jgi:hypothetical protein
MDKSAFEKRIVRRAEERFDSELAALVEFLDRHPIGRYLKLKFGDEELDLVGDRRDHGLINSYGTDNIHATLTNIAAIKAEKLEEYQVQETDAILNQLGNLGYLFNQQ